MKWTIIPCQQFDTVAAQWDQLNQGSLQQPILDSAFVEICLEVFASGSELIALCEDKDGPLAIGIFHRVGVGHYATFQPSQAPLGLFIARGNQLSKSLLCGLTQALPGYVVFIDLLQQDSEQMNCPPSLDILKAAYITTSSLAVASNYDEFFISLGKNMRQNHNKVRNRCAKQEINLEATCLYASEEVSDAIETFGRFESSGWKGDGGTAVNIDNDQGVFYLKLLQHYAHQNRAELWQYQVDGQTVAIDLCIKSIDVLIILKTAYNEEFNKLSPALQLKFAIFKHHANQTGDQRLQSIEFFGKAMEWHKRFNSTLRQIEHMSYFSHPLWLALYRLIKRLK